MKIRQLLPLLLLVSLTAFAEDVPEVLRPPKGAQVALVVFEDLQCPDCRRAAHSSSVGPIDETQLFYLESRGIPPDEARKFIVLGFLEPVVARVPLADARDRLRERLEEKWDAGIGAGADAAA